ncbi:hypothetical protein [Qipengyuania sp. NPDC077563]|uniref:hypothetical protein n=1 Tax=Qipengyuania sp. NPDC077563 TaxID=3364497 RepID=UPI00384F8230
MVYAFIPEMEADGNSKMGLEPFNSDICRLDHKAGTASAYRAPPAILTPPL